PPARTGRTAAGPRGRWRRARPPPATRRPRGESRSREAAPRSAGGGVASGAALAAPKRGGHGPRRGDEHEDERQEVEDFADRVGEEEDRPVEVVGQVADLGGSEEGE